MNIFIKHSTRAFFWLMILSLTACISETEEETIQLAYQQTYCTDLWDLTTLDTQQEYSTENRISDYLAELNIEYESLSISAINPAEACLACSCLTGKIIYLIISNPDDEPTLESLGFYTL